MPLIVPEVAPTTCVDTYPGRVWCDPVTNRQISSVGNRLTPPLYLCLPLSRCVPSPTAFLRCRLLVDLTVPNFSSNFEFQYTTVARQLHLLGGAVDRHVWKCISPPRVSLSLRLAKCGLTNSSYRSFVPKISREPRVKSMNFVTLLCTMYNSPLGERVLIISCRMRTIILTRLFKDAVYFWVVFYVRPCLQVCLYGKRWRESSERRSGWWCCLSCCYRLMVNIQQWAPASEKRKIRVVPQFPVSAETPALLLGAHFLTTSFLFLDLARICLFLKISPVYIVCMCPTLMSSHVVTSK